MLVCASRDRREIYLFICFQLGGVGGKLPGGLGQGCGALHQATSVRPFLFVCCCCFVKIIGKDISLSSGLVSWEDYGPEKSRCHQWKRAWKRMILSPGKVEDG